MSIVRTQSLRCLPIVLMTLAVIGCGRKEDAEPTLTVITGTITLDGQPLPNADLEFHYKGTAPEAYKGAASRSDAEGVFQVKSVIEGKTGAKLGILPGPHNVIVTRTQSDEQPEVPKKYTSLDTTDLELKASEDRSIGYVLELSSVTE